MGDGLVAFKWEWGLLAFKRKWVAVAVVVLAWQTLSGLNLGDINQNIIQASTAKQDISLSPQLMKQFHFHYNHSHRKWFILTLFPGYDLGWFMLSSLVSGPRKVYPVTTTMIRVLSCVVSGVIITNIQKTTVVWRDSRVSMTHVWLTCYARVDTCVHHMCQWHVCSSHVTPEWTRVSITCQWLVYFILTLTRPTCSL